MIDTLILYHADTDGFAAAYAAWSAWGEAAVYRAVQHDQSLPAQALDCRLLYLLDFTFPLDVLERIRESGAKLEVLDHHITGLEDADRIEGDRSGVGLAWERFHPGQEMPLLLRYVQDRDLWKFELRHSRAINAALRLEPRNFHRWNLLVQLLDEPGWFDYWVARGTGVLVYQEELIRLACAVTKFINIGGYRVPAVCSTVLRSEICEELLRRYPEAPFAAVFFCFSDLSQMVFSLRSQGEFDVAKVAECFGGGGRKNTAAFRRPLQMEP